MLSRKLRCSWSSADRWCSNYISVISNFIAQGVTYIRGLTVCGIQPIEALWPIWFYASENWVISVSGNGKSHTCLVPCHNLNYRKTSNISHTKPQNLNVSCILVQLSSLNPLKPGVENEDVVGAAPTGDAPTTSELSTMLLPTKVRLISEVLR